MPLHLFIDSSMIAARLESLQVKMTVKTAWAIGNIRRLAMKRGFCALSAFLIDRLLQSRACPLDGIATRQRA
jgi:hypothetical protein